MTNILGVKVMKCKGDGEKIQGLQVIATESTKKVEDPEGEIELV